MKEAIWATQNALKECRQQIIDQNEALIRAQNELPAKWRVRAAVCTRDREDRHRRL